MDYSLAPNDVLDFKDFLYPFFEDKNVTSTTFRSKYQMFMDQLLKVAFQCISENSTHYLNTQQLLKPDSFSILKYFYTHHQSYTYKACLLNMIEQMGYQEMKRPFRFSEYNSLYKLNDQ